MNHKTFSRYLWREWIRPLALPVLFITAAKSALADINYVPSGSMKPTILEGDVVFINKLAYDLKVPFTTHRLAHWSDPKSWRHRGLFRTTNGHAARQTCRWAARRYHRTAA